MHSLTACVTAVFFPVEEIKQVGEQAADYMIQWTSAPGVSKSGEKWGGVSKRG